jgi:hypothetical protein
MTDVQRVRYLRYALIVFGALFLFGLYPLTVLWPSGWVWHSEHSDYLTMIIGVYATLGIFLLLASGDPLAHLSLIRFTLWSSAVHGGIMLIQSLTNPDSIGHLWGDVLACAIVVVVLGYLTPRQPSATGQVSLNKE